MAKLKEVDYAATLSLITGKVYVLNKHAPCPLCGGKDRFRLKDDGFSYFCNQCGNGFTDNLIRSLTNGTARVFYKDAVTEESKKQSLKEYIDVLTKGSSRGLNRETKEYLKGRFIDPHFLPGDMYIYTHQSLYHAESKRTYTGIILPIVKDGKVISLHRTFLDKGGKAKVDNPKKIVTPLDDMKGSSVPLMSHGSILGTGEGLETCLAAYVLTGIPVHPALNEVLLRSFPVPEKVQEVHIFADYDSFVESKGRKIRTHYPGQGAAHALASRIWDMGKVAYVRFPPPPFKDWNDYLISLKGNTHDARITSPSDS